MGASSCYYWLEETFPPTLQRYLPHYRHACIACSQLLRRHTVGIGRSCLIIALQSNAAYYVNFPSLMTVIKHPSASASTPIFSLLILLVKHKARWLVSNDVKC